jgi:hypothetical protein
MARDLRHQHFLGWTLIGGVVALAWSAMRT